MICLFYSAFCVYLSESTVNMLPVTKSISRLEENCIYTRNSIVITPEKLAR